MNMKRTAAALLTASTMMSLSAYAASPAADVKIVDDDAVIHNAQTVKLVAEEAELVIKGQVEKVIVTDEAEESEIIVKKGASVKEILVEGEETEISVLKGAKVDSIIFNGEEGEVEGRGTVGTVEANRGEAEIDVPGAKVIVGEDADEVEAGDVDLKPGDVVVINPDGEGVTPVEPETPEVPDKPAEGHEVVLTVLNVNLTKGQAIQIRCNGTHENGKCDFIANLDSVKITAPNGGTDTVMPEGVESVFEEIGYTVDSMLNVLTIGKDTLNQAFAQNEDGTFAAGEYTIALTAKDYSEKTVAVSVADVQPEPEQPEVTLPAPEVADVVREGGIVMGQYDRISFNEDVTEYLPAITSVTLNGAEAKKVTNLFNETKAYKFSNDSAYGGADKFIDFTTDCFAGEVALVIKADGYEDLTLNLVDGKIPDMAAPVVKEITEDKNIMGNTYKVSFDAFEGITDYLKAVTKITLNGDEAQKVTNLFGETKAYKLAVADDSQSVFAYDVINFTTDCFVGTVEVVVTAKGYETLTFNVKDGKLVPAVKAAPEVADITYKTQFMGGNYYNVSFKGTEEETTAFVEAINNISINGQKVAPVASFFNDTMSYKTSNDPAFGGKARFVDFTEDCFQGQAKVVISADGYEDLTFNVKDGELAPAAKTAPEVADITYKTQFMGGNYYIVSFQGTEDDSAAFVEAINNISINDQKVAPVASFYNDTMSYKTSNDPAFGGKARFVDFTEDCFKGEAKVVISADGYEDLTFTVTDGKLA